MQHCKHRNSIQAFHIGIPHRYSTQVSHIGLLHRSSTQVFHIGLPHRSSTQSFASYLCIVNCKFLMFGTVTCFRVFIANSKLFANFVSLVLKKASFYFFISFSRLYVEKVFNCRRQRRNSYQLGFHVVLTVLTIFSSTNTNSLLD